MNYGFVGDRTQANSYNSRNCACISSPVGGWGAEPIPILHREAGGPDFVGRKLVQSRKFKIKRNRSTVSGNTPNCS